MAGNGAVITEFTTQEAGQAPVIKPSPISLDTVQTPLPDGTIKETVGEINTTNFVDGEVERVL